jgi:hypothetical protein
MRLWSLHPELLDTIGLIALWREALLAKKVLEGKTKGYKNHPQLERFKNTVNPINCINQFLSEIFYEAEKRGYNFNKNKINWNFKVVKIKVTSGQIEYEFEHLLNKLKKRDRKKYKEIKVLSSIKLNPVFKIVKGRIEKWEKLK